METNINITINEQNKGYNNLDNITRCPECNLIASLKLYYKNTKPIINYFCENNHKGNMPLEEYMKVYNNHSLLKQKCEECNKNEVKVDLFCFRCGKFLCYPCLLNHPNNEMHNTLNFKRYDSFCKVHSNSFAFY